MATSGNFVTSNSGQGDAHFFSRMIFEWWQVSSGISGSVGYHGINYHLKSYDGQSSYYQTFYNGSMNVDGAGYSWGATRVYGGGATVFGDYGNTLYTNSSGDRSFSASAQGGVYYNTINTTGSGSWALDHINLWGGIDYITVPSPLTDESTSITTGWHNYTGTPHLWYRLDLIDGSDGTYHFAGMANPHVFSGFQSWMQQKMVNTTVSQLYIYYGDDIDSNGSVDNWQGPYIYTCFIANDTGQANPTFTTYTFSDSNSTTATITGNNQYLIQGVSTLQAVVTSANKATPNKQANMDHYTYTIGGYSANAAWSSGSTVTQNIGTISDVTGAQTLSVIAVDSRTNQTTVRQTVNILPYAIPTVTASAVRANGFDDALILTVTGSISPLTISGTDKNSVHSVSTSTANRVEYRVATDGGSYGSWTDLASTQTSATGVITGNSQPIIAASGTASSTHSYQIQVQITDKLNSTVQTLNISSGTPTLRIGTDGNVYFKEVAYQSNNSLTTSSTPTPVGSASLNILNVTALAANATFGSPTGTAANNNRILIRIKDNGTARTLAWNSIFRGGDAILPTTTVVSKTLYVGFAYNSADTKWDCVMVAGNL